MERRVRTGCGTCRKRHVKCDETKPICNRCRAANFVCEGYEQPRQVGGSGNNSRRRSPTAVQASTSGSSSANPESRSEEQALQSLAWRHANYRKDELPLYHHFVTTTVIRIFRSDHIAFWRDQVAQMSYGTDLVYEALLAIGAAHRATLLACTDPNGTEVAKCKVLALRAYGSTLQKLPQHLARNSVNEQWAVLVVLLFLTYFECFMENAKGALRHLWAAIQYLRESEGHLTRIEPSALVPLYDAILRLDFLAQKLVPFACSSFMRVSNVAMIERPFWSRPSLEFAGVIQSDPLMTERYRLIELICGHNKLSRVIWGCWYPSSERPTRAELIGFYDEMKLWKQNSQATFACCPELTVLDANKPTMEEFGQLPMPPPPLNFTSSEGAVNVIMWNGYIGCCLAMISTTDPDPESVEREAFHLVYQNMQIAEGLLALSNSYKQGVPYTAASYKPCDAINMGISIFLYHGARRSFRKDWMQWAIDALRTIGREGLSNGHAAANTLDIMCQLETLPPPPHFLPTGEQQPPHPSTLGAIRDRLIPLLMPHTDDEEFVAYYLRYGLTDADSDERTVRVIARAKWRQDDVGTMYGLILERYDTPSLGEIPGPAQPTETESAGGGSGPLAVQQHGIESFAHWRREMEKGWHGLVERAPLTVTGGVQVVY